VESPAGALSAETPSVTRDDLIAALARFDGSFGFKTAVAASKGVYTVSGPGVPKTRFSQEVATLERDRSVRPLSPFDPVFRQLADGLVRPGERLPLVAATCQRGAFRVTHVAWLDASRQLQVKSAEHLLELDDSWDGRYPDPETWLRVEAKLRKATEKDVATMERRALAREREGLEQQVQAARLRLEKELGRHLACLQSGTDDFGELLYDQINRDIATSQRLKQCLEKLGGYPQWDDALRIEAESYAANLTDNQRRARQMGKELDAALQDPRWGAAERPVSATGIGKDRAADEGSA
jgi:hypothetical protein